MDKEAPHTKRATCRDQFEPERCRAQNAENSAVIGAQPAERLRHHQVMDIKYAIDLPELAAAIGANPRSLRNAFYQHPDQFPPGIYLPGVAGVRFLVADLPAWLESKKKTVPPPTTTPKPQGRPRKASAAQIARARQGKGGAA
ncbi:hypothetical protein [Acidithiobacillus ferrooxidans]|nr:hypothetical protein [Acidithiobacillus ferrooxidans]MBU2817342.1 hypothetical protein [Acidithiobacillus ferrooxidans]QZT53895.1 hypothetical protein K7B00_06995 [Acidithiobacillus ferrooxidans]RRN83693.1 MAG: hypothetical protein EC577_06460 [Acidithiobacillus ferrooxidans]